MKRRLSWEYIEHLESKLVEEDKIIRALQNEVSIVEAFNIDVIEKMKKTFDRRTNLRSVH